MNKIAHFKVSVFFCLIANVCSQVFKLLYFVLTIEIGGGTLSSGVFSFCLLRKSGPTNNH